MILKESSEARSIFDTQEIVGGAINTQQAEAPTIFDTQQMEARSIFDTQQTEAQSIFDTQRSVGDAINIQYCLTEGKHLEDGNINSY